MLEQSIVVDVDDGLRRDLACEHQESALADLVCGRRVSVERARSIKADLLENKDGMPSWNVEELIALIDGALERADVEAEKYLKAMSDRAGLYA